MRFVSRETRDNGLSWHEMRGSGRYLAVLRAKMCGFCAFCFLGGVFGVEARIRAFLNVFGRVWSAYSCVFGRVWALFAHLRALIELWGLRRGALSGSWGGFWLQTAVSRETNGIFTRSRGFGGEIMRFLAENGAFWCVFGVGGSNGVNMEENTKSSKRGRDGGVTGGCGQRRVRSFVAVVTVRGRTCVWAWPGCCLRVAGDGARSGVVLAWF